MAELEVPKSMAQKEGEGAVTGRGGKMKKRREARIMTANRPAGAAVVRVPVDFRIDLSLAEDLS